MKSSLLGQKTTANRVENLPAETGPTALVRLCGALIGAALGDRIGSFTLPEITERIHVPDGGVDARYTTPVSRDVPETGGLVGPGLTVYQIKYRNVTPGSRRRLVAGLARSLRNDFDRGSQPDCDRYVLMTNLDLAAPDREKLSAAIAPWLPRLTTPPVIWGAAELALHLNLTPHLGNLFVADGALCTLDVASEELRTAYPAVGLPSFVGRSAELTTIREFAADERVRLLRVAGPRYVGRTRLVLEALRPQGSRVVWSSRADAATIELFRDLDTEEPGVVLVVDRCDPATAASLAQLALERGRLKTILIIDGRPDVTDARETRSLVVAPLGEDDTLRLAREAVPGLPFRRASWLVEVAGGMPGLLLHAAALVQSGDVRAEEPTVGIRARLGKLVADGSLRRLHLDTQRALGVLAVLPALGVTAEAARELDAVSQALGVSGDLVREQIPRLREAGFIQERGRFVEVVPPLLAEHLVQERLSERLLAELAIRLHEHPGAFLRLLERLRDIDNLKVRTTIESLLSRSRDGWFPDFPSLVRNARRLEILAPAAPRQALECLEHTLADATIGRLRDELVSGARRAVVRTLEDLTLRPLQETYMRVPIDSGEMIAFYRAWARQVRGLFPPARTE